MPRRVVYSLRVRSWIDAETEYLYARSPAAAQHFRRRLADAERVLSDYPQAGRRHQIAGVRQFVAAPYVIRYREWGLDLQIIDIRHSRQRERPIPQDLE